MGEISIYRSGADAIIETWFGVRIVYNWIGYLTVTVPGVYGGTLAGLCGNFDGNPRNDFQTPNGQFVTDPDVFGKSWTVENDPPGCNNIPNIPCPNLKKVIAEQRTRINGCGIILDKNGPFRNCHATVNPESIFKDCAYDACYYNGRLDVICEVVSSYATICLAYGITVYEWRSTLFCGK